MLKFKLGCYSDKTSLADCKSGLTVSSRVLQYNSKLRIVKPKKPEIGVWKTVEAKGRRKYQKEKPKHIRGELPAKSKRQTNVNDASQPKTSKQAKSGPKQNFRDQNRQWNYHHMSMPFPSYGSSLHVP